MATSTTARRPTWSPGGIDTDSSPAARGRADGPVLLTGASGLLGHWLRRTAPRAVELVALAFRNPVDHLGSVTADLRDPRDTAAAVRSVRPRLVVHAAYAHDRASIVDATRHVVDAAAEVDAEVLLVSTEAVFSGDGVPRDEDAVPDPVWDYGRWKVDAEELAAAASRTTAIVRPPLLVSRDPDDHVALQLRSAVERGEVSEWFTQEVRRPALASEVAAAIWAIAALGPVERAGCWHLAGPQRLSRFEVARRLARDLGLPEGSVRPAAEPSRPGRPRDLELTDGRARRAIAWDPSPVIPDR